MFDRCLAGCGADGRDIEVTASRKGQGRDD